MEYKKYRLLTIVCLLIFILYLLLPMESYSKLTENSIDKLRVKENIEILNYKIVNNVEKPFAYIFYKKGNKIGSYSLRIINKKLVYKMEFLINENINEAIQTFGTSTGYPYVMIRIHDEEILNSEGTILFSFGGKTQYKISIKNMKKDYIIVGSYMEAENQISSLEIFDKENKLIYKDK